MNQDDDIDSLIGRKPPIKQGRRAGQPRNMDVEIAESLPNDYRPPVPARARKTGGWAEETLKSGKNRNTTNAIEQERFLKDIQNTSDDIPLIPDIDDIQSGSTADLNLSSSTKRSTAYKELDSDLLKQSSFGMLGDISLSILTNKMYSEKDVMDPDVPWTMESLFNELILNGRPVENEPINL